MKARHASPLLFLVPSAMLAAIAAVLAGAAGAGVLWIFVYGDDPWPASANTVVMALATLAGLAVLAGLLQATRRAGGRAERSGGLRKTHVRLALGLSVGIPLLVLLHQWQVGNLGGASL